MKNAFDGLISSSGLAKGRIIELVTRPIEITIKEKKSKKSKKSRVKTQNRTEHLRAGMMLMKSNVSTVFILKTTKESGQSKTIGKKRQIRGCQSWRRGKV